MFGIGKVSGILWEDLRFYFRNGIHRVLFLILFAAIMAAFIWYRYFENPWFFFSDGGGHPLFRYVYYVVAYFIAVFLVAVFFNKHKALLSAEFWILSFCILFVLYLNHFNDLFGAARFPGQTQYFLDKLFYNLQCTILYAIAPLIIWYRFHKKEHPEWNCYGFIRADLRPYLFLLLFMLPLLYWASTRADFQLAYPRYKPGSAEGYYSISSFWTVSAYESSYVTQFITLEWFFRGFIVLSLSRFFGAQAVWIMVAVYVFLHFGKPLHETIGSFFGGYILGTIAFYTKSIYGGMIVHVGIALAMEILAAVF